MTQPQVLAAILLLSSRSGESWAIPSLHLELPHAGLLTPCREGWACGPAMSAWDRPTRDVMAHATQQLLGAPPPRRDPSMADEAPDDEAAIIDAVRALEKRPTGRSGRGTGQHCRDADLRERVARRLRRPGTPVAPRPGRGRDDGHRIPQYLVRRGRRRSRPGHLRHFRKSTWRCSSLLYLHWEILGRVLGEDLRPLQEQLDAYHRRTGREAIRGDARKESLTRLQARQLIRAD